MEVDSVSNDEIVKMYKQGGTIAGIAQIYKYAYDAAEKAKAKKDKDAKGKKSGKAKRETITLQECRGKVEQAILDYWPSMMAN